MFKSFIPYCHAKSIYEVDPNFFKKQGIKVLFIDLDNTLDSFKAYHAKQNAIDYIKSLLEIGITPIVVSNNKGKRVSNFASDLKIDFVSSARKPSGRKIRNKISDLGLTNDDVMLVGDQMMTDVLAGKNSKIRVMLTEKIVKEDQWTTHINRLFDKPIRKYHLKRNNLKDWREI